MTDQEIATAAALALDEKKAKDIRIYDVKGLSTVTDYTVVASGTSAPHLRALIRDADARLTELGEKSAHVSGDPDSGWVVLDFITVIVHVFSEEARAYYDIEKLWATAKELPLPR